MLSVGGVSIFACALASMAAALWAPAVPAADGFTLGRLRGPVAGLWTLLVVAALTVPPLPLEGIATRHLPPISSATGLALGAAVYLICIRPRILAGTAGPPPETRTSR